MDLLEQVRISVAELLQFLHLLYKDVDYLFSVIYLLAFLDSQDFIGPEFIERMLKALELLLYLVGFDGDIVAVQALVGLDMQPGAHGLGCLLFQLLLQLQHLYHLVSA